MAAPKPDFSTVVPRNLDPFFYHPIAAKLTSWDELKSRLPDGDPKVELFEVCDMNEWLIIQSINQDSANRASRRKQEQDSKRGSRRRR